MNFWGEPCRQDEHHQVLSFYGKMPHFFPSSFFFFFFSERSQRLILLAESTFKSEGARFHLGTRFKMSPILATFLFFGWVPPGNSHVVYFVWNKSCELKVSKQGILKSMLVLLLSDQTQEATADRTLSTVNRDGRMVAEMSRDSKYRVYTLNNVLWNKHINDRGPNAWWFYDTRKDSNRLFRLEHTYKRISHILMICWSA